MKKIKTIIFSSLFSVFWANIGTAGVHWSYEGHEGPQFWGKLDKKYTKCQISKQQSPINITKAHKSNEKSPVILWVNCW